MSGVKAMTAGLLLLLLGAGSAQASLYDYTLTGSITYASPGVGVQPGDSISISIDAEDGVPNSLEVYLDGSMTPYTILTEANLAAYMTLFSADETGLSFAYSSPLEAINVMYPAANPYGTFDIKMTPGLSAVYAQWTGMTREIQEPVNPVPVPAAAWLLGSGLAGVAAVRGKLGKKSVAERR